MCRFTIFRDLAMAQKNCSKCGKAFGCQSDSRGCWCEDLHITTDTLVQLRNEFDNCLCPQCLALYQVHDVIKEDSQQNQ